MAASQSHGRPSVNLGGWLSGVINLRTAIGRTEPEDLQWRVMNMPPTGSVSLSASMKRKRHRREASKTKPANIALAGFIKETLLIRCEPAWRADEPVNSGNGLRYLTLS